MCEDLSTILNAYERAQEVAHHSDIVIWEVTALIWSANTLLLGFIIEAIKIPEAQVLIVALSVLGGVLTFFVSKVWSLGKIGQHTAFAQCQDIEKQFPENVRLHTKIHAKYPPQAAQKWVHAITKLFLGVWAITFFAALRLLCKGGWPF
jgi:hypothetical protein